MLCVIDEYTRECPAVGVGASLRSQDVPDAVATDAAVWQARIRSV